jgi:hypothetical protein
VDMLSDLEKQNITFETYNKNLIDSIIKVLRGTKFYKHTIQFDHVNNTRIREISKIPEIKLYSQTNIGKYYVSIDMIHANFSPLVYFNETMEKDTKGFEFDTYLDFICSMTPYKYYHNSKYFRQVVMGKVGFPKSLEMLKYLMGELFCKLSGKFDKIYKFGSDELIIETSKDIFYDDVVKLQNFIKSLEPRFGKLWKIRGFYLDTIPDLTDDDAFGGVVRCDVDDFESLNIFHKSNLNVTIHGTNKDFHSQCYKKYFGIEYTKDDLKSMKDNYLITFDDYHI